MALVDGDFVGLIEACYRIEQSEIAWLEGVAKAAAAVLDVGFGTEAYLVDLAGENGPRLRNPVHVGGTDEWKERWRKDWWEALMVPMSGEHVQLVHSLTSVSFSTELWRAAAGRNATYGEYLTSFAARGRGRVHAPYFVAFSAARAPFAKVTRDVSPVEGVMYPDSFNVGGIDPSGRGAVLCVNLPTIAGGPPVASDVALWGRMSAHIATGYRLLRKLAGVTTTSGLADDVDAVLDPSGKVQHATLAMRDTVALDALRERVVTIDRAREKDRSDGRAVSEAWTALNEGRWLLVDQFDRDGRRFYLARPNTPVVQPTGLSERETQTTKLAALGHSNKLIAYELGLSASTVATHLKTAAAKLGVDSRFALIRAVRQRLG